MVQLLMEIAGHGGSGWSLSFGCAEEVAAMVDGIMGEGPVLVENASRP
jgi:hypothetical protein